MLAKIFVDNLCLESSVHLLFVELLLLDVEFYQMLNLSNYVLCHNACTFNFSTS